jgi:RNA polymerase sigma-70 factor (ECF subfamily)
VHLQPSLAAESDCSRFGNERKSLREPHRPVAECRESRVLNYGAMNGLQAHASHGGADEAQSAAVLGGLVQRMRAADQRALAELYDLTIGRVYGLARVILRDAADAEEVACDTFAQAWTAAAGYDSSQASVIGWLLMICRSRALDRLRRRKARAGGRHVELEAAGEPADPDAGPEELLLAIERGTRLHEALDRLGPERRRLVGMAFLQGLSHQEIAQATGLPLGTVKSHVRRALAELRGEVNE